MEKKLTPKKRARPRLCPPLEILGDIAHGLDGRGRRRIAREQHVEIGQIALRETLVELADFLGAGFGAFDLAVASVVAWWLLVSKDVLQEVEGLTKMDGVDAGDFAA